ncbi:hypothetical protein M5E87_12135 [Flavonifractor plautii]|nr:hypothetical protein M5E87_12135 [Flavonifractor plautii]
MLKQAHRGEYGDRQIPAHRHGGRRGHPLQQRQRGGPRGQRPAGCLPHRKPHHLRRPQGRLCSLPCQLRDGCGRLCALRHPDGRGPAASAIRKPTLFLAGRYDAFSGAKLTEGYFAQWFRDGYGFRNYRNVYSNGTSNYDIETYIDQLGFTVTDDPAKADIIVGNVALDQGRRARPPWPLSR